MSDTMLQAQGLRPFDPYSTLQLHPSAPRDLVVSAYWTLVARYKRRLPSSPQSSAAAQLAELNAAYSILMDDDRRLRHDTEFGFADVASPGVEVHEHSSGLFGLGTTVTVVSTHEDYYHLLRIDRAADTEIIDVAYSVLQRRTTGYNLQDVFLHDLFEEAYHTLRNPQLRAQYDAGLASKGNGHARPVAAPAPAPTETVAVEAVEAVEAGEAVDTIDVAAAAALSSLLPDAHEISEAAAADPVPPVKSNGHARTTLRERLGLSKRDALPAASLVAASGARINNHRDVLAAEQARLLTLREDGPVAESNGKHPYGDYTPDVGLAELQFVAGPRAESRVAIGAEAITLGSSLDADVVLENGGSEVAPEHARIWLHGDRFIFRQMAGSGTTVAGQDLTLPLVMLDDGDEITIGPHRIRFNYLP